MSILSRIAGRFGYIRQAGYAEWLAMLMRGGLPTRAGVSMTPLQSLQVATVLACCRVIAEGLGALPFVLRQRTATGAEDVTSHSVVDLLAEPNGWMTWQELVEMLTLHAVLTGNGFAIIQRGLDGRPLALLPVQPGWVETRQNPDWTLEYRVTWPDGRQDFVGYRDMFHLRGPSWDGKVGLDILRMARETVGLAAAIEWTQAGHFGKGPTPPGYLKSEQTIDKTQAEEIQDRWAKSLGGDNAGKIAILSRGFEFKTLSLDYAGAQTIETRKLQIEEICRALRVFPQMIGAGGGRTTYASAESFFVGHVTHTLRPWAVRWEQTLGRDLLAAEQRPKMFFWIKLEAMLRADSKSRAAYYTTAVAVGGWMTRNEVREAEGLNRAEGLDVFLQPVNLQPADLAALLAPDPAAPNATPDNTPAN